MFIFTLATAYSTIIGHAASDVMLLLSAVIAIVYAISICIANVLFSITVGIPDGQIIPDGSIRLVNGSGPYDGRVEVYLFGQWGTVLFQDWDFLDAIVVCRQLGYPTALATKSYRCGNEISWLSYVECTGFESTLTLCSNQGYLLCTSSIAGVICDGKYKYNVQ